MVITTMLLYVVARDGLALEPRAARAASCAVPLLDLAFFGANLVKIVDGGWFPLVIAAPARTC